MLSPKLNCIKDQIWVLDSFMDVWISCPRLEKLGTTAWDTLGWIPKVYQALLLAKSIILSLLCGGEEKMGCSKLTEVWADFSGRKTMEFF